MDQRLAREFSGHDVQTVSQLGWAGAKNGDLLTRAEGRFDVFITVDRNLSFQQQILDRDLAVVILRASSNRLEDLRPLVPKGLEVLASLAKGQVVWVG
jgi:hypothetical protein